MGNYVSCAFVGSMVQNRASPAKVIFPTGQILKFYKPTKAAELMFETPNFFLVNTQSLRIGRRFSALNADEDIEMSNIYAMFPMQRLKSVISDADMCALFLAVTNRASSGRKGGKGKVAKECGRISQVVPESSGGSQAVPRLNLDDIEELCSLEFTQRWSMFRSKKPMLETVMEEPVCSR
ncbi:hypothetical protein Nepgr_032450 [Nepenthes gracilis]|uniref:Uncharacterized protein n=1 Tax=Nepenthes gracilis TaxID=150966 RepID=A0AAD3TJH4_NEPGR|nr:hypothetical protein Nepgr_032450 [Nepenthes gracilis]